MPRPLRQPLVMMAMSMIATATLAATLAAPHAAASDLHDSCTVLDAGLSRVEPMTGVALVCTSTDTGMRWENPGSGPAVIPAASARLTGLGVEAPTAAAIATLVRVGERCPVAGEAQILTDGHPVRCVLRDSRLRWTEVLLVADPVPGSGTTGQLPIARPLIVDPLDPDLGDPSGLPPGVSLPPGAVMLAGSPQKLASIDYFKNASWMIQATVPGSDAEAITTFFAGQCATIGWFHDATRVERLPAQNPPGAFYDQSVTMVAGECRTYAGSAGDPTRRRPWFLTWSGSVRPGASQVELVVELRANSRLGGRP